MKMTVSENIKNNIQASKVREGVLEVRSFYNKHFPTDRRSYNLRVPFVGLILSVLVAQCVATSFLKYYVRENPMITICYIFVATGVSYELYYGLKIGDRKQYTPWIILKICEICLELAALIYNMCEERRYFKYHVPDFIYFIIVIVLNIWVAYVVISKSVKQFKGPPTRTNTDENIYDNYDNV